MNWHCRIGRVRPKLRAIEGGAVDLDAWNDLGFAEQIFDQVRRNGDVLTYSFVTTHENGNVCAGTKLSRGNRFQVIGGLFCEALQQALDTGIKVASE